jgi:hypothetical protein
VRDALLHEREVLDPERSHPIDIFTAPDHAHVFDEE